MTLIGQSEETKKIVLRVHSDLLIMLEDSREDIGPFQGLDPRKIVRNTHVSTSDGEWDKTAEDMMLNFGRSGHPTFRATSA